MRRYHAEASVTDPITIIYVAGAGHSGSTLLDLLLGSMPGVLSMGEVNTIWARTAKGVDRCSCTEPLDVCALWSAVDAAVRAADPSFEPRRARREQHSLGRLRNVAGLHATGLLDGTARRRLAQFVRRRTAFYAAAARESGCRVLVDSSKSARYGLLLRHLPGLRVRYVNLVRDPRAVAYSAFRRSKMDGVIVPGGPRAARAAARQWVATQSQLRLTLLPSPVKRVRYEDLCRDPAAVVAEVAAFAGIEAIAGPFDPARADPRAMHISGGNHMRRRAGAVEVRLDDAWRRELPAGLRRRITAATLPLLALYGYVPARG